MRLIRRSAVQSRGVSEQPAAEHEAAAKDDLFAAKREGRKGNIIQQALFSIEEGAEQNITPNNYTKVAVVTGLTGTTVGMGSIIASAELSPWFSWSNNALSDILKHPMAPLFASGVIEAGAAAMVYSVCLAKSLPSRAANEIGAGLLAIGGAALTAVGLTSGFDHAVAASTYFFSAPAGLMLFGVSMYEDKPKLGGVITMGLSAAATITMLTGYEVLHRFTAAFEISEAAILGGWIAVSSATLAIISKIKARRARKAAVKGETSESFAAEQLELPL